MQFWSKIPFIFLATAEDSKSTYDDGAVLGSIIGSIDTRTMKIKLKQTITNEHKFEGLTLYKNNEETLEFLLCEDKDSDVQESDIYKLTLRKWSVYNSPVKWLTNNF